MAKTVTNCGGMKNPYLKPPIKHTTKKSSTKKKDKK